MTTVDLRKRRDELLNLPSVQVVLAEAVNHERALLKLREARNKAFAALRGKGIDDETSFSFLGHEQTRAVVDWHTR